MVREGASTVVSREQGWYVTAARSGYGQRSGLTEAQPIPSPHLKRLGAQSTACGVGIHSWATFWLEDPTLVPALCRACVEAARAPGAEDREDGAAKSAGSQPGRDRDRSDRHRAAPMDATGMVLLPRSVRSGRRRQQMSGQK